MAHSIKRIVNTRPDLIGSVVYFYPTKKNYLECVIRDDGTISPKCNMELRFSCAKKLADSWKNGEFKVEYGTKFPSTYNKKMMTKISFDTHFFWNFGRKHVLRNIFAKSKKKCQTANGISGINEEPIDGQSVEQINETSTAPLSLAPSKRSLRIAFRFMMDKKQDVLTKPNTPSQQQPMFSSMNQNDQIQLGACSMSNIRSRPQYNRQFDPNMVKNSTAGVTREFNEATEEYGIYGALFPEKRKVGRPSKYPVDGDTRNNHEMRTSSEVANNSVDDSISNQTSIMAGKNVSTSSPITMKRMRLQYPTTETVETVETRETTSNAEKLAAEVLVNISHGTSKMATASSVRHVAKTPVQSMPPTTKISNASLARCQFKKSHANYWSEEIDRAESAQQHQTDIFTESPSTLQTAIAVADQSLNSTSTTGIEISTAPIHIHHISTTSNIMNQNHNDTMQIIQDQGAESGVSVYATTSMDGQPYPAVQFSTNPSTGENYVLIPMSTQMLPCPGFEKGKYESVLQARRWVSERYEVSPVHIIGDRLFSKNCQGVLPSYRRHMCYECKRASHTLVTLRSRLMKKQVDEKSRLMNSSNTHLTKEELIEKLKIMASRKNVALGMLRRNSKKLEACEKELEKYRPRHSENRNAIRSVVAYLDKQSELVKSPKCSWKNETDVCDFQAESTTALRAHILENHLKPQVGQNPETGTPQSSTDQRTYVCKWQGCNRLAPFHLFAHLRRHMTLHMGNEGTEKQTIMLREQLRNLDRMPSARRYSETTRSLLLNKYGHIGPDVMNRIRAKCILPLPSSVLGRKKSKVARFDNQSREAKIDEMPPQQLEFHDALLEDEESEIGENVKDHRGDSDEQPEDDQSEVLSEDESDVGENVEDDSNGGSDSEEEPDCGESSHDHLDEYDSEDSTDDDSADEITCNINVM